MSEYNPDIPFIVPLQTITKRCLFCNFLVDEKHDEKWCFVTKEIDDIKKRLEKLEQRK